MAARKRKQNNNIIPTTSPLGSEAISNLPSDTKLKPGGKPSNAIKGENTFPTQPKDPLANSTIGPKGLVKPKPKKPWTKADLDAYQRKHKKGKYAPKPGGAGGGGSSRGGSAPAGGSGGAPASTGAIANSAAATAKAKREARRARLAERQAARREESELDKLVQQMLNSEAMPIQQGLKRADAEYRGQVDQTGRLYDFRQNQMAGIQTGLGQTLGALQTATGARDQANASPAFQAQLANLVGNQAAAGTGSADKSQAATTDAFSTALGAGNANYANYFAGLQNATAAQRGEMGRRDQLAYADRQRELQDQLALVRSTRLQKKESIKSERDKQALAAQIAGVDTAFKQDAADRAWAQIGMTKSHNNFLERMAAGNFALKRGNWKLQLRKMNNQVGKEYRDQFKEWMTSGKQTVIQRDDDGKEIGRIEQPATRPAPTNFLELDNYAQDLMGSGVPAEVALAMVGGAYGSTVQQGIKQGWKWKLVGGIPTWVKN